MMIIYTHYPITYFMFNILIVTFSLFYIALPIHEGALNALKRES